MEWYLYKVIAPAVVILALIFIHEFGHFIVAKWCGVGVVKFCLGFGPSLYRFQYKETVYQLSLFPLGGFVRMVGDMPDMITGHQVTDDAVREGQSAEMLGLRVGELSDELREVLNDKSKWFVEKGYFARSAIVFAGPLFNLLYAFFVVAAAVLYYGETRIIEEPIVGLVTENSPAERAGLKPDDRVTSINDVPIDSWEALARNIHASEGGLVRLQVERESDTLAIEIMPDAKTVREPDGSKTQRFMVGIGPSSETVRHGAAAAIVMSLHWTWSRIEMICGGLVGMLQGKGSADDLAGPQFILETAGKFAEKGFESLLYFSAFLSITLAVLNLLPIPVLDGGHLMFFTWEAIFGPISMRIKEVSQTVAMLLLFGLMIFAIRNDIVRDPKSMESEITWEKEETEQQEDSVPDTVTEGEAVPAEPAPASGVLP